MKPLILASTSRYRKALLDRLRVPFSCVAPGVEESEFQKLALPPKAIAEQLALAKAKAVQAKHPDAVILGSDQLVCFQNEILGKPLTLDAAFAQISTLEGQTHELITAIALLAGDKTHCHTDITRLKMRRLDPDAIARYLEEDKPFDCAGSYKIELLGISLFEKISGEDPTAIEGLPLMAVSRLLRECGFSIP